MSDLQLLQRLVLVAIVASSQPLSLGLRFVMIICMNAPSPLAIDDCLYMSLSLWYARRYKALTMLTCFCGYRLLSKA